MSLQSEKFRRMGNNLIRVVHECNAGMRQGATYYRNAQARADATTDPAEKAYWETEALNLLRRAARLPYRVEARFLALLQSNGGPYTMAQINSMLAITGTGIVAADLNAELTPLKAFSDTLKTAYQGGATLSEIADLIDANAEQIGQEESIPIPGNYVDDF